MIELTKKYNNSLLAIIFTIVSFLFARTLFFQLIMIFPSSIIEYIASLFIKDEAFNRVAKITILILFIFTFIIIRKSIELQKNNASTTIIGFWTFLLLQFIIHPLGFYIYWGIVFNFKGDGQLFFLFSDSCVFSSFCFIPIGIILDVIKILHFSNQTKTLSPKSSSESQSKIK